jgi:hypothetical protein
MEENMNGELERMWKWLWLNLRYYPGVCMEVLRKNMNNLSG